MLNWKVSPGRDASFEIAKDDVRGGGALVDQSSRRSTG
ncbi:Hypothetical protein A7982_04974 [Minicystis rosea]|nr:Hypothetical protein A7982_04974 [Minicystis rosea]